MSTCVAMSQFRWVTPDFAVAPQLAAGDIAKAAAQGFRTIVNNRPDNEVPGQPSGEEIRSASAAQGLEYRSLPFSGPPPPTAVAEMTALLEEAPTPVLAYCRSGNRSILAWAMAQALSGARTPDEIIALARNAGYQVASVREALEALSPRS